VKTFEDEVISSIRKWSRKLARSSNYVLDSKDLAGVCGLKAADPRVWEKLREIWFDPNPDRGGLKGLRAYLIKLCRNAYTNELAKKFAAKRNETDTLSLDFDYTPDDPVDSVTLLDFLTADDNEYFSMRDVREAFAPDEYKIVLDLLAGASLREMAEDGGQSKSSLGRKTAEVRSKLTEWLERQQATPWTRYVNPKNRIMGGRTLRPDRISEENANEWNDSLVIRPFYVCSHLYPAANDLGADIYQNFDLAGAVPQSDRYGLCQPCWEFYWRSLSEWLAAEVDRLEYIAWLESELVMEFGGLALGTPRNK
jgi:hypothetical protein